MEILSFFWFYIVAVSGFTNKPTSSRLYRAWSEWTEWSACSRTCDAGVRARTRTCRLRSSARTFDVVQTCAGPTTEYDLCKRQKCTEDSDFRLYQCSLHNGKARGGFFVDEWVPYLNNKRPCELQCITRNKTLLYSFGKAIDGTPCKSRDTKKGAICVNGRCANVDCAGQLGTDNQMDVCGVCRGDNSSCVNYRNSYWARDRKNRARNSENVYDYDPVAEIPAGATLIRVQETSVANFLALMDENGNFIVNGNWKIGSPGVFWTQFGSEVTYHRSVTGRESIYIDGPTRQNLLVLVIGTGRIPTVDYGYWLSSLQKPRKKSFLTEYYKSYYTLLPSLKPKKAQRKDFAPHEDINSIESEEPDSLIKGYKSYYHHGNKKPKLDIDDRIVRAPRGPAPDIYRTYKNSAMKVRVLHQRDLTTTTTWIPVTDHRLVQTESAVSSTKDKTVSSHGREPMIVGGLDRRTTTLFDSENNTLPLSSIFPENTLQIPLVLSDTRDTGDVGQDAEILRQDRLHARDGKHASQETKAAKLIKKEIKFTRKKKKRHKENVCLKCARVKQQRKNFCVSDFVLRIVVSTVEVIGHELRYEVKVIQSFKNKVPIMPLEFIWTPDTCKCPNLRVDHEYIVMGHVDSTSRRESRLVVSVNSFTRKYTRQRARAVLALVRDQRSKCKKFM